MKTGIIIPCYNEEKRLNVSAFVEFINQDHQFHLCFVNDGSKDNTVTVLKKIQQANPAKVSIIDLKKNAGKAAAVRTGSRYLHSKGNIDYIGFIDADLSTDFEDFGDLVKTLQNNNQLSFVFGSRAKNTSEAIEKNKVRAVISKIINMLVRLILGLSINDTQCGAKVFKTDLVPIIFANNFISRWLFDVEIFIRMKRYFGKKHITNAILEQPLKRWVHMEDSKLGLKDSLEIPYRLISIWFNYNVRVVFSTDKNVVIHEPAIEIHDTPLTAIAA